MKHPPMLGRMSSTADEQDIRRWKRMAKREGVSFSTFIRRAVQLEYSRCTNDTYCLFCSRGMDSKDPAQRPPWGPFCVHPNHTFCRAALQSERIRAEKLQALLKRIVHAPGGCEVCLAVRIACETISPPDQPDGGGA